MSRNRRNAIARLEIIAYGLIKKLLYIPHEWLHLAAARIQPFAFRLNKRAKVNSAGIADCRGWRLRMALHCEKWSEAALSTIPQNLAIKHKNLPVA